MVVEIARDLVRTQDQMGPRDNENLVFKYSSVQAAKIYGTKRETTQNLGHTFYLDHDTNGQLDTANGIDGQQILLDADFASETVERVVSLSNTFVEACRDTTYVDTAATTATVDTTNYRIDF